MEPMIHDLLVKFDRGEMSPSQTRRLTEFVMREKLLETLGGPDFCIGDYQGSKIHAEGSKVAGVLANEIPVQDDGSFGVFFYLKFNRS